MMKIKDVQAFPIEFPLDVPARDATGTWTSWNTVIVKVTAADTTFGWGEICLLYTSPRPRDL